MRAVEAAMRASLRRASQLPDPVQKSKPGSDAQVAWLRAEHVDHLSVPSQERHNQWRAPVTAREEVGLRTSVEQ